MQTRSLEETPILIIMTVAEGAAMALFLAMFAVWCIIGATPVPV